MLVWTDDTIRFLSDAAEYNRFYDKIAAKLTLDGMEHKSICDAGCGTGHLSRALSKNYARVTSVDESELSLSVLRKMIKRDGIANIEVRHADVFSAKAPLEEYDAMAFCFFGNVEELLPMIKKSCRERAFIVKKNWWTHRFSAKKTPLGRYTLPVAIDALRDIGVKFEWERFELNMGQPFRSLEDAALFFQIYSREEDKTSVTVESVMDKLVPTGEEVFPYYYPSVNEIGILSFSPMAIPDNFVLKGTQK